MLSRREFLRQSSAGALGLALAPDVLRKKVAPSDRLRIAHIGLGGMGIGADAETYTAKNRCRSTSAKASRCSKP